MNTVQIRHALTTNRHTSRLFRDVRAADELPQSPDQRLGVYVVNTHESFRKGEHWVVLHYRENELMYFDPYGIPPPGNIYRELKRTGALAGRKISHFDRRIQGFRPTCAHHCIYFILTLVLKRHTMDIFDKHLDFNDRLVVKIVTSAFDVNH